MHNTRILSQSEPTVDSPASQFHFSYVEFAGVEVSNDPAPLRDFVRVLLKCPRPERVQVDNVPVVISVYAIVF